MDVDWWSNKKRAKHSKLRTKLHKHSQSVIYHGHVETLMQFGFCVALFNGPEALFIAHGIKKQMTQKKPKKKFSQNYNCYYVVFIIFSKKSHKFNGFYLQFIHFSIFFHIFHISAIFSVFSPYLLFIS